MALAYLLSILVLGSAGTNPQIFCSRCLTPEFFMQSSIFYSPWSCGTTKEGAEETTQCVRAMAAQTGGPELTSPKM